MKVSSRFLLFFLSVFASSYELLAQPIVPPKFVYRADFRNPGSIFSTGLRSIGENVNILDHVRGTSCSYGPKPSTAFVATTSEEAFAEKWGGDQLWIDNSKGDNVYIYKIRATENFYSAYHSLLKSHKKTKLKDYKSAAGHYEYQKEWLAHNGIPSQLILSVKVMEKNLAQPGKLSLVREEQNPGYKTAPTQGNTAPFNDQATGASRSGLSVLASRLPFLGGCYGSCPNSAIVGRKITATGSCPTKKLVFEIPVTDANAMVWDPVTKSQTERLVPWKEEKTQSGKHSLDKPGHCVVEPGTKVANSLRVHCPKNVFYDSFVVLLRAGQGDQEIVHSKHTDGVTSISWMISPKKIPLADGSGLFADYDVKINEVFSGENKGWWSEIHVYPIYPDYFQVQEP